MYSEKIIEQIKQIEILKEQRFTLTEIKQKLNK